MSEAITRIPFGRLVESSTNPRQVFSAGAMAELVESIKSQGVLQPIVVRPLVHQLQGLQADSDDDEQFEVVFGHRRFRAAQQADVGEMPCIVRAMTDSEVSQAQLHENLARADVHPIEEAEGYSALMRNFGVTADQLVQQTGKSRSYIYGRLALLKACSAVRHACLADEIGSETALLIARLRTDKLQQQALATIKAKNIDVKDGGKKSFRHIRDLLREKFTLALHGQDCLFDPGDVFLVPDAGPCTSCPKRSGNAPEFQDIATAHENSWGSTRAGDTGLCTDPECYETKKRAHLANAARALESAGMTVVAGNAARQAVDARGNVKGAFVPIQDARRALKTLPKKSLSGTPTPEIITIQDPRTGKTFEAMRRADLEKAGLQLSQASAPGRQRSARSAADEEADRKAKVQAAELENRARRYVLDQVRARAAETGRTLLELRLIVLRMLDAMPYRAEHMLTQLWNEHDIEDLRTRTASMSPDELGRVLLDCALLNNLEVSYWSLDEEPEALAQAAAQYGIDFETARQDMAYTPSFAARAPEGEGDAGGAAAGAENAGEEESQMDKAGCAGNAIATDKAGAAGQVVDAALWPFPKQPY